MKGTINKIDLIISVLVLWIHYQLAFGALISVPVWRLESLDYETSYSLRRITDYMIIVILSFHIVDVILGRKYWTTLYSSKLFNYTLIGILGLIVFPYLRLWFGFFYYVGFWADLVRAILYCGSILFWILTINPRNNKGNLVKADVGNSIS